MGQGLVRNSRHRLQAIQLTESAHPRQQNATPWDAGQSQPPLKDLLASGEVDFPKSGRALVPGCGRVCILAIRGAYA